MEILITDTSEYSFKGSTASFNHFKWMVYLWNYLHYLQIMEIQLIFKGYF